MVNAQRNHYDNNNNNNDNDDDYNDWWLVTVRISEQLKDRYIGYDGHKLTSHKFNLTGVIFSSVYAIFLQQACKTLNKIYLKSLLIYDLSLKNIAPSFMAWLRYLWSQ